MYGQIAKKTFDLILEKKYALMKVLFLPFILLSIIEYFSNPTINQSIGKFNIYILLGLSFLITIIMSISVHRILLLGENSTSKWGIYKPGKRELNFILKAIGLGLLVSLLGLLLFFISGFFGKAIVPFLGKNTLIIYNIVIAFLGIVLLGTLFARISLIFPAISIDKSIDFSEALALSKNDKFLVFITIFVIPIIVGILLALVYGLVIGFLMGIISDKLSVLFSLLNIFITVLTIAFLSTTYEYLIHKKNQEEEIVNLDL